MTDAPAYQVLARKYRPESFADLIGQDAMVRTLKNAFQADRIAQAFILTGIRGTGKTTTARIIAKGMNCVGPDGEGGPTTDPCGVCEHCVAIAEGRHVDVMEMDAASRTGVGDIREIIDSVHYRAASARFKIYIIDEVHMLSVNAFNALLKTLEEPPEHVKFIFATTEIRKVPVTVLSRCQRFDLRRIEPEVQMALLRKIADAEGGQITEEALALITRAAEGSARDAQKGELYLGLDPAQVEALAAAQYRDRDLADFGGGEDELDVLGGLFERFQERVEGVHRQHMDFVDDVDLVAGGGGAVGDAVDDLADVVHAGARGRVHFHHVDMAAFHDRHAVFALATRLGRGAACAIGADAIHAFGDDPGGGGFAGAADAGHDKGLGDAIGVKRVFQRAHHGVLTDEIGKGFGAILAGKHLVLRRVGHGGLSLRAPKVRRRAPGVHRISKA